jgi:OmpA-OmpF porin, OOP family
MTSRDRILARRAQLVAAALAMSGCREPEKPLVTAVKNEAPPPTTSPSPSPSAPPPPAVDTDGDGVPDEKDKCPTTYGAADFDGCPPHPCLSIVQQFKIAQKIYFAKNSAKIDPASTPIVDDIVTFLKTHSAIEVEVRGCTDVGEKPATAAARAKAVRDYLVSKGIATARLTTKDLGEQKPADEKNRRVEFEVTKQ